MHSSIKILSLDVVIYNTYIINSVTRLQENGLFFYQNLITTSNLKLFYPGGFKCQLSDTTYHEYCNIYGPGDLNVYKN